jgi:hypothetical protein
MAGQFLLPSHLQAQAGSSDVLGTVTDSSGAVIVGAKVTIKDLSTSAARVATTDAKGEYIFNTLPNSQYTLKVEMQGFKAYTIASFQLSAGVRLRQDAKLATGSVTETVEVTGLAALMQTDTSEVASTVADNAVQDLPLSSRNYSAALQVQPGMSMGTTSGVPSFASGTAPEDRRQSFVIVANGQYDALNNQLIDGFDNNERDLGLAGVRPSIDGIAEVKMDTSSYSAEYGRAAGAVLNVVTKSGSNDFHGSAYEYFRNEDLDAMSYFDLTRAEYRSNSYGGSFGGPVRIPKLYNGKNKTFFFVDWEQDRLVQGISSGVLTNMPTLYELNSVANGGGFDLSDIITGSTGVACGPGTTLACDNLKSAYNYVPVADIDPIMKNYFLMLPAPNFPASNPFDEYSNNLPELQTGTNFDARIDQHFGSNDVLFGRFAYNPVTTTYPETIPQITAGNATAAQKAAGLIGLYPGGSGGAGFPGPSKTTSYNMQLDYVHIFSPKLLLDLKTGYTRVAIASLPYDYNVGAAQEVGFAADVDTGNGLPAMGAFGALEGSANSVPLVDINNTFQYAGSVTYTRGSHNIKAGGGLIRRQVNAFTNGLNGGFIGFGNNAENGQNPPWDTEPWWTAQQNFIAGYPEMEMRADLDIKPGFRAWEIAGYVQDDWRATNKVTVNLGVRYDVFTPFTEAHGNYANFLMSCLTSNSIATAPSSCFATGSSALGGGVVSPTIGVNADYKNFAPRVGFAYSMNPATVLRGGFGMSFFPVDVGEAGAGNGPPSSVMQNYNPPTSFNYQAFMPDSGCTMTTALGGTTGCIDNGPVPVTATPLSTFVSNGNVTTVSAKPLDLRSSYVEMANLALQRQLGKRDTVTVAWVGEFGRALLRAVNGDQPLPPGEGAAQITQYLYQAQMPNVSTINTYYNGAMSSYNAMQLVYAHSLAQGLTVNGNYTWAHNMTNSITLGTSSLMAGPASLDFGNSVMDLRHRIAVTATYELPFGKNAKGVESALVKGWKFNEIGYWETGSPFSVTATYNLLVPALSSARADQVGNPNSGPKTLTNWFNAAAFVTPPSGRQGNQLMNQVFGPHQRDVDLSMDKDFSIVEKLKAQFRAECFNISNTPNFGEPGSAIPNPTARPQGVFNAITSVQQGSVPREIQFALKLLF